MQEQVSISVLKRELSESFADMLIDDTFALVDVIDADVDIKDVIDITLIATDGTFTMHVTHMRVKVG